MRAVWWETMMNGMVFGIPQVGNEGMDGKFFENKQLNPDIVVYNTPENYEQGKDKQLEAGVKALSLNPSPKGGGVNTTVGVH